LPDREVSDRLLRQVVCYSLNCSIRKVPHTPWIALRGHHLKHVVLTASAVEPVSQIHDRMPVILDPEAYDAWLDPATSLEQATDQLGRNLNADLRFYRVGRQVNSSKYEGGPDCIEPINPL
jgi:putative SOS response-associated peptidase YedK